LAFVDRGSRRAIDFGTYFISEWPILAPEQPSLPLRPPTGFAPKLSWAEPGDIPRDVAGPPPEWQDAFCVWHLSCPSQLRPMA
ncbi:MAG: hypothetical protein WBA40_25035, partial [Roseiarcus sp.]